MRPAQIKPYVSIDILEKLDIRVGKILEVSEITNSKNLMKLTVDFGDHNRSYTCRYQTGAGEPDGDRGEASTVCLKYRIKRDVW